MEYSKVRPSVLKPHLRDTSKALDKVKSSLEKCADELESSSCGSNSKALKNVVKAIREIKDGYETIGSIGRINRKLEILCNQMINIELVIEEERMARYDEDRIRDIKRNNQAKASAGIVDYTMLDHYTNSMNRHMKKAQEKTNEITSMLNKVC